MLTLPIKKKWFDMIVSGEKKEEYREIKPYYDSRFMNAFGFLLVGGQMVYGEAAPEESSHSFLLTVQEPHQFLPDQRTILLSDSHK